MASSSSSGTTKHHIGLLANALKRKDSFIQFLAMGGILLLSMRSLGQKITIFSEKNITDKMKNIKGTLLDEAALASTGGRRENLT
ncbi:hypothetical protein MKW92_003957 [Papaver armeniacum]|nr:hypothetical protein MKW92_003957 [Papaver armeniacum]